MRLQGKFQMIIGIDFSRWKNGQLGKKILFNVLQVWYFPFYNYQQTSYTIDPTEYYVMFYYVILMFIDMVTYPRTMNQTRFEQVIQWTA